MADTKETGYNGQNGQNGQNGKSLNGHTNGASAPKPVASSSGSKQKKAGVVSSLMALRKASRRPLPTEMGDGSYRAVKQRPTLAQDLRSFGKDGEYQ